MFKEIEAKEFEQSIFSILGEGWALVTAEADGKANTMTVQWGGLGFMWGKDVSFIVLRPSRYTKEFVDKAGRFSISFLPEEYKKQMSYLGSVSGRFEDKITKSGLKLVHTDGVPYFEESDSVLACRALYSQPMAGDHFLKPGLIDKWYPERDFHILYISEVEKILVRK